MKRVLGPALASLALLGVSPSPSRAEATHPLITDPTGDVDVFEACAVAQCVRTTPSAEPSLDIVQGDVSATATTLTARVEVVDIDAPLREAHGVMDTGHAAILELPDGTLEMEARRDAATGEVRARVRYVAGGYVPSIWRFATGGTAVIDGATNTATVSVTFDALNAMIASYGDDPVGIGTTASVAFATRRWRGAPEAYVGQPADGAGDGTLRYRFGD